MAIIKDPYLGLSRLHYIYKYIYKLHNLVTIDFHYSSLLLHFNLNAKFLNANAQKINENLKSQVYLSS